jgi:hypothetical protein
LPVRYARQSHNPYSKQFYEEIPEIWTEQTIFSMNAKLMSISDFTYGKYMDCPNLVQELKDNI